jgi:hypothetical protein
MDVGSDAPVWAQRAARAADGGVVDFRAPSLCRHAHRELLRSALPDVIPRIPATACNQRNYVERYSRFNKELVRIGFLSPALAFGWRRWCGYLLDKP